MASTALAEQHHNMDVKLQPTGQTIDLKAQCKNRDKVLKEKYHLSDDEIKKLNNYKMEVSKATIHQYGLKQQQYEKNLICQSRLNNYFTKALKNEQKINEIMLTYGKLYQVCRSEENLKAIPASLQEYMQQTQPLRPPLRKKFITSENLEKASATDDITDITICNAIKAGTISNKDAIVPQLKPVFTHNPTEQQNN